METIEKPNQNYHPDDAENVARLAGLLFREMYPGAATKLDASGAGVLTLAKSYGELRRCVHLAAVAVNYMNEQHAQHCRGSSGVPVVMDFGGASAEAIAVDEFADLDPELQDPPPPSVKGRRK